MSPSINSGPSPPLPANPNLEHLRHQAKDILKAQRYGDAAGCQPLRHLRQYAELSEADLLAARVKLKEAQLALALDYGFDSWEDMRKSVQSRGATDVATLAAVRLRCNPEIPGYAGAGVPLAVTAALNHAGVDIDYMTYVAATGWAFSFGYNYGGDPYTAYMAVQGDGNSDGPFEIFAFLPPKLGHICEIAPTQEPDKLWPFVRKYVDAGVPIMSEHVDGGLICDYREAEGKRQVFFDSGSGPGGGWTDIDTLHPYHVAVFHTQGEPLPGEQLLREALAHAVAKGSPHEAVGAPQGTAALEAYVADVRDPAKDFADCGEWFCWAAFQRLTARRCAAVWLTRISDELPQAAADHVRQAAEHYQEAFELYEQYRQEVHAGEPTPLTVEQRARTPERIAVIAPILEAGIEAEKAGLASLAKAVAAME